MYLTYIIILGFLLFGFSEPADSKGQVVNLMVNGDFENPAITRKLHPYKSSGWEWHHAITKWAGNINIDTSITRNSFSKYSMKFTSNPHISWGECNSAIEGRLSNRCRHCEIKVAKKVPLHSNEGKEMWYGISYRFQAFPSDKRRFYILQFHVTKNSLKKKEFFSPHVGLRLFGDSLVLTKRRWIYDSTSNKTKCCMDLHFSSKQPLLTDTWYDVQFHVKWSQTDGLLEGRYKRQKDTTYTNFTLANGETVLKEYTMLNKHPSYLKAGMYWAWDPKFDGNKKLPKKGWFSDTLTIYIDNIKAAESYEKFIQIP